ncbi:MAG: quinone-interacting membrane-bound oxidoreductase complex subunit QmoC [Candidatus Eremiobacteraeota bacterium]|nr:quinone-interacting membrane-bound oxidoreductase complex subunit QmoC [Candidatus Eremiobacteraeota bacterium]
MATTIKPDLAFKQRILGLDAPDLTACYQCGTCSSVCPISTPDNPFPRKEMAWVQWGLKDRVLANSSIWSCHQCGLCSAYCPRDAEPANVMAALREYSIEHYATPRFLATWIADPRYLPILIAIPVVVLLIVLAANGTLAALPTGQIVFTKFVPDAFVEIFYTAMTALAVAAAVAGGLRYLDAMCRQAGLAGMLDLRRSVVPTLRRMFAHDEFSKCTDDRSGDRPTHREHARRAHGAIFYGFLALVITTTSVAIGTWFFNYREPWPLWHPVKILGNLGGIALVLGLAVFLIRRIVDGRRAGKSTYSDWLFLTILALTALTGFGAEAARLAGLRELAYPTYFVHLVLIFFLLVYFPFSKLGHVAYRSVAMLFNAATTAA